VTCTATSVAAIVSQSQPHTYAHIHSHTYIHIHTHVTCTPTSVAATASQSRPAYEGLTTVSKQSPPPTPTPFSLAVPCECVEQCCDALSNAITSAGPIANNQGSALVAPSISTAPSSSQWIPSPRGSGWIRVAACSERSKALFDSPRFSPLAPKQCWRVLQ
jgi:hypothetical protein